MNGCWIRVGARLPAPYSVARRIVHLPRMWRGMVHGTVQASEVGLGKQPHGRGQAMNRIDVWDQAVNCPQCGGRISDRYMPFSVCQNCYGTTDDPESKP